MRACIRPKIKAVGKATPRHIRTTIGPDGKTNTQTNPDPYIRLLLEEPNQYMTWQMYAEKMETQLILNNNAFALIQRDDNGFPFRCFPSSPAVCRPSITKRANCCCNSGCRTAAHGHLHTPTLSICAMITTKMTCSAHRPALRCKNIMEVIGTTDRSIINAVRNGAVVRWLLKFAASGMRPEDIQKQTENFANAFLDAGNSKGVAGTDVKADAVQLTPHDYVPNALQSQNNITRLYSFFNTNEKIVKSSFRKMSG